MYNQYSPLAYAKTVARFQAEEMQIKVKINLINNLLLFLQSIG